MHATPVCKNESDVEHKVIFPLLTTLEPDGLGFDATHISTKANIRRLDIGKGTSRKSYFPDYLVLIEGLPLMVVEAKAPGEDLANALSEARLYAHEINSKYPPGVNPCRFALASDGLRLVASPSDSDMPIADLAVSEWVSTNTGFAVLLETISLRALGRIVPQLRAALRPAQWFRAASSVGGDSTRNEEITPNTFGQKLAFRFGHLFNPRSPKDRATIVSKAYIPSRRRERYIEPIDRTIRSAIPPGVTHIPPIENSAQPREVIDRLGAGTALEHQIMLLVGSVGSGKSTFIDYLFHEALSAATRAKLVLTRIDLNVAPLDKTTVYQWITQQLIASLRDAHPELDFDDLTQLQQVFAPELGKLRKGALKLLKQDSDEYRIRLADALISLQKDESATAQALTRYLCAERGKLLIVALDNCDKRVRDDQLLMFDVAQWIQKEFRCLVILPLRDVTYDLNRNVPPLDTALKDLVFRIEPPVFSKVLRRRIELAVAEERESTSARTLTYVLPGGVKVEYSTTDQGLYLSCILRSLFEHDLFVRRVISGIAGRDVRKAMEIFLEFCRSGHIGEDEIFKIRHHEGSYALPLRTVTNALLRMDRRFYDGSKSYMCNVFQADPRDLTPSNFGRLAVLRWLERHYDEGGPAGVPGHHRLADLLAELATMGLSVEQLKSDALYLLSQGAIVAEHLRRDRLENDDLVSISPGGFVHLWLLESTTYLAACAEDTWCSDQQTAERIADRIGKHGQTVQYSESTEVRNAADFVDYLERRAEDLLSRANPLKETLEPGFLALDQARNAVDRQTSQSRSSLARVYLGNLPYTVTEADIIELFKAQQLGTPSQVFLPRDQVTHRPRGFAFVELADIRETDAAIEAMDGIEFLGRTLLVKEAFDRR